MFKTERYGAHLYAIRNSSTGRLVRHYDPYTDDFEVLAFLSRARADLWIAEHEVGVKHN